MSTTRLSSRRRPRTSSTMPFISETCASESGSTSPLPRPSPNPRRRTTPRASSPATRASTSPRCEWSGRSPLWWKTRRQTGHRSRTSISHRITGCKTPYRRSPSCTTCTSLSAPLTSRTTTACAPSRSTNGSSTSISWNPPTSWSKRANGRLTSTWSRA